MDNVGEQEKSSPQEIPLDTQTAKALGNGLRSIFRNDALSRFLENVKTLKEKLNTTSDTKRLNAIGSGVNKTIEFVKAFGESKNVSLIPDNFDWDFKFSEEKISEGKPEQGEIILDKKLSRQIKLALDHNLNNFLTPILGFSSLIHGSSNDSFVKEKSLFIEVETRSMADKFDSVFQEKEGIRLTTNDKGETNIQSFK